MAGGRDSYGMVRRPCRGSQDSRRLWTACRLNQAEPGRPHRAAYDADRRTGVWVAGKRYRLRKTVRNVWVSLGTPLRKLPRVRDVNYTLRVILLSLPALRNHLGPRGVPETDVTDSRVN